MGVLREATRLFCQDFILIRKSDMGYRYALNIVEEAEL